MVKIIYLNIFNACHSRIVLEIIGIILRIMYLPISRMENQSFCKITVGSWRRGSLLLRTTYNFSKRPAAFHAYCRQTSNS